MKCSVVLCMFASPSVFVARVCVATAHFPGLMAVRLGCFSGKFPKSIVARPSGVAAGVQSCVRLTHPHKSWVSRVRVSLSYQNHHHQQRSRPEARASRSAFGCCSSSDAGGAIQPQAHSAMLAGKPLSDSPTCGSCRRRKAPLLHLPSGRHVKRD